MTERKMVVPKSFELFEAEYNSGGVVKLKFYQKEMCDLEGGSTLHVKAEQIWRLF